MDARTAGRGRRLRSRLVPSKNGTVTLRFLLGGRPLSVTNYWRKGPAIIGPVVARALLKLAGQDRLVLSPHSGPDHQRKVGAHQLFLSAQHLVYLDYVLTGRAKDWAWIDRRWRSQSLASIAVEVSREDASEITKRYFDSLGFRGFVIPRASHVQMQTLVNAQLRPIEPFDPARLPSDVTWFEDADDGCGLKIGTKTWSVKDLAERLGLGDLDAVLASISLPTNGKGQSV
jgi:hypothetical protein